MDSPKQGLITAFLWIVVALLVSTNVYTVQLLLNASNSKSFPIQIPNFLLPSRRQLLTSPNIDHVHVDMRSVANALNTRNLLQSLDTDDADAGTAPDDSDGLDGMDGMDGMDPLEGLSKEERDKKLVSPETVKEFYSSIDASKVTCDWSMEYLFNQTINVLYSLKSHNYMEVMKCPAEAQAGWRPTGYVPWIFGNQCESWWHRDAVFIMSHLLNKNMKALEYGSGASTLWMSHFVGYVIGIENDQAWFDRMANITQNLQVNNIEIRKFRVHIPYVEIDLSGNPGGFDWSLDTGGGIDFVSIDGRIRIHCTRWAIKKVKQHGGIVLLDNSDRDGDDGINATKLIPKHWLRYDSYNLPQHLKQLPGSRWLENSRTTIWITRHPKCMDNPPPMDE